MALDEIITIVGNRLTALRASRTMAASQGDLSRVVELDTEITETENTLVALKTL